MELINGRYRIIKTLRQDRFVSTFLVADILHDRDVVQLNIINPEYFPEQLMNFYTYKFITLSSLNSSNIIKLFDFGLVDFIDNKKIATNQYFYTNEYIESNCDIYEIINDKNLNDILDIFAEICRGMYYLHLKGFVYGELNIENVVINFNNDCVLKLKDLATVELQKYDYQSAKIEHISFKSPEILRGEAPTVASDIYSLGILLKIMIRNYSNSEFERIIKKMTSSEAKGRYENIYMLIEDINNSFNKKYKAHKKEEVEKLNFNIRFIGRDYEINRVMNSYKDMIKHDEDKNLILVHGEPGIGKTRFLKELKYLFYMKRVNVLSCFALENHTISNNKGFIEIVKKILAESDKEFREKYRDVIMSLAPQLYNKNEKDLLEPISDDKNKFKLLNSLTGFIADYLKNKRAVFIIDNIHFANEFYLELLEYLYVKNLTCKNVMFIVSYCDSDFSNSNEFSDFIRKIVGKPNVIDIPLHGFNEKETIYMLQSILNMPFSSEDFAERIFSKTYGNPLFIQETIKMMFSKRIIYINESTGNWESLYDYNYDDLPVPSNIEQAVLNQIREIDSESEQVLKTISIFNEGVSTDVLSRYFKNDTIYVEKIVEKMVERGILCRKIEDKGFVYDFSNLFLKNIIYDRLDNSEKKAKHEIAVNILENEIQSNEVSKDELIYHLEKSENKNKLIKYCIQNADKMKKLNNRDEAIKNLKKAVAIFDNNSLDEKKMNLLSSIGDIYHESDNVSKAIYYYNKAADIANKIENNKVEINLLNKITTGYIEKNNIADAMQYLLKCEKALNNIDYLKGYLSCQNNKVSILLIDKMYEEAYKICSESIELCGERYYKLKGLFYRSLGSIFIFTSMVDKALLSIEYSIKCFEKINYQKGIVLALNNIGVIYSDYYQDTNSAISYFRKMKEISERNHIIRPQTLALTNLASSYLYNMEYNISLQYFYEALEKSRNTEYESNIFYCYNNISLILLKLHDYKKAYEYYNLSKEEFEKYPVQRKDNIGVFYELGAEVFYEFGKMDKANVLAEKVIELYKNDDTKIRWDTEILLKCIKISSSRNCDISNEEFNEIMEIIKKFHSTLERLNILYDMGMLAYENCITKTAQRFLDEAKKVVDRDNYLNTMKVIEAKRLYLEAVLSTEENKTQILESALEIVKKEKDRGLHWKVCSAIGDFYFSKKNYFYAVNYYFDACHTIQSLTMQLPNEYKVSFVTVHNMLMPFSKLIAIDKYNYCGIYERDLETEEFENISVDKLDELFDYKSYKNILSNSEYIKSARNIYGNQVSSGIDSIEDLIANIPSEPMEGLELIIRYLSSVTLSTNAMIIMQEKDEYKIVSSFGEETSKNVNRYVIERVKSLKRPILITEYSKYYEISGNDYIYKDVKTVICIPVTMVGGYSYTNSISRNRDYSMSVSTSQMKVYLYLESTKMLNNFNEESMNTCTKLSRFIGFVMEKHFLNISCSIDKLTGVYTRKYLEDFIDNAIEVAGTKDECFSLIMFDCDLFKSINDKYGHQTGDEVLKKVCKVAVNNIRKQDICGRYGGEEFIIVLPRTGKNEALGIAERVRKAIENEKILGNATSVTVSIGVSTYPEHGHWKQELIDRADQALYVAKQMGRNNSQIWNNEFSNRVQTNNKLTGIITGNSVQDYRNVLAMVDIAELIKSNMSIDEKIYNLLGRIVETTEAEYGILFTLEGINIAKTYGRKIMEEKWMEVKKYNESIVDSVIKNQRGMYMIDWDNVVDYDYITGIPDWQSIIVVPLMNGGIVKGVLYLTVSTKVKEFSFADFNFVTMLGQLAAAVI